MAVVNTHQREGVTSGQTSICSTKSVAEKTKAEENGGNNKKINRGQTMCRSEACKGLITKKLFQFSCLVKCLQCPPNLPRPLRISSPNSIGAKPEIIRGGEQMRKGDIGKTL